MMPRSSGRRGVTMLEILLGLAITAGLFVAIATVIEASTKGMSTNDQILLATRTARTAMQNMSDAIRRCDDCDVGAGPASGSSTATSNVIYFLPVDNSGTVGALCAYIYDAANKELILDKAPPAIASGSTTLDASVIASNVRARLPENVSSGTAPTAFSLAKNIDSLTFTGEYASRSTSFGVSDTRMINAQITLTVLVNNESRTLRESIVLRRVYQQN